MMLGPVPDPPLNETSHGWPKAARRGNLEGTGHRRGDPGGRARELDPLVLPPFARIGDKSVVSPPRGRGGSRRRTDVHDLRLATTAMDVGGSG